MTGTQSTGPDADILDHVTDFRLMLAETRDPADNDPIWWSVLIEIADISINDFAALASDHAADVLIPVAYDAGDRAKTCARQPVALFARSHFIRAMNKLNNPYHVSAVSLGAATPADHLDFAAKAPDHTTIETDDTSVVMAIVDYGIAFAHDLLRKHETATRVEHISVFGARPKPDGDTSFGRSYGRAEIDTLLKQNTYAHLLDEDILYQQAGMIDWSSTRGSPVAQQSSHGTHVAALAAGFALDDAVANRPLICAALPSHMVEDTTGVAMLPSLYLAFHTLIKQAQRFVCHTKGPTPVIFNFSFGNAGGPHDGTGPFADLFEYYFGAESDWSDRGQKAWLTLPAGNLNLSRLHATTGDAPKTKLDLTLLPDDHTPTVMQVWGANAPEFPDQHAGWIKVTSPTGHVAEIDMRPGQVARIHNADKTEIARLACQYERGNTGRSLTTLSTRPTATHIDDPTAPAGIWTVEITRDKHTTKVPLDIRIRRDETLPGTRSTGRQAWFSNADYVRFNEFGAPLATDPPQSDCPVTRHGTISGFACGEDPIVVAAYTQRNATISTYSGSGPLNPRTEPPVSSRISPDLTAKGDESTYLRGVIGAGSRSGSSTRFSGTSAATPRVARSAAEGIHDWNGTARSWSVSAVEASPFPLAETPANGVERSGAGAIRIPIDVADR